jgi:Fic family protein
VTFSGKEAPEYFHVPTLVKNLCDDLRERIKHLPTPESKEYIIEVVKLLAWFQHRFVFIHPFQDYNGRTARMLTILVLLKLNLPPIEIKADTETDRKNYILAMQEADNGNYSKLEVLISDSLFEMLEKFQK